MKIISDLHTHTVHSHKHGKGTVDENVRAAIDKGLRQIAISDHGFSHPFYGIKDIDRYLNDISAAKQKYAGVIDVLSSVELNLTSRDGDIDLPQGAADRFDRLLMGYHKMAGYFRAKDLFYFMTPVSHTKSAVVKNTDAYIKALNKYKIDVITHPGYGLPIDLTEVAKAAKERGTALEINSKHAELTPEALTKAAQTGVMFAIGSDAHSPERVGDFEHAVKKAEIAKIPVSQIINAE